MSDQRAEAFLSQCAAPLCEWYQANKRSFPWRETPQPYRVWLSEIMLQQTRIEAALPYYDRFLQTLPTIKALAEADEAVILKLWEGLGYYSRVRNMQKAARIIVEQFDATFPTTFKEILSLPGIGEYTAGAIASICFGEAVPAVDGNVLRVLARLCNDRTDVMSPLAKKTAVKRLQPMLENVSSPGDFNQGIMELGERVCLPNGAPLCEQCPLSEWCMARKAGTQAELPVRIAKVKRRVEERSVVLLFSNEPKPRLLLCKRPDKGLLAGMWELPSFPKPLTETEVLEELQKRGVETSDFLELCKGKHIFSHIEWRMFGYAFSVPLFAAPKDGVWVTKEELNEAYALPSAFRPFASLIDKYLI